MSKDGTLKDVACAGNNESGCKLKFLAFRAFPMDVLKNRIKFKRRLYFYVYLMLWMIFLFHFSYCGIHLRCT